MQRDVSSMKRSLWVTLLELVVGVVLGGCMLALGSWAGAKLGSGASDGWGDIIGALFGSVLTYPVGFVAGMWLVAWRLRFPHSLWRGIFGAALGLVLVLLLAEPLRLNRDSRVIGTLLYLVPSVVALFGFNHPQRGSGPAGG
jgi:threonine/homoserine efflux transporter RhtA